ncbi:MAG: hypothetical protein SPI34_07450 [Opitutales bacterium]|nr:hypothetical protein [Opitutales bacterium]
MENIKMFGADTPEFEEALSKIPQTLCDLLISQFNAKPKALRRGEIKDYTATGESEKENLDTSLDENIEIIDEETNED